MTYIPHSANRHTNSIEPVSTGKKIVGRKPQRQGAMLVLIVTSMVILFIAAAFAVDVAYMHATRAELRTATDAAARAASEALGRLQDSDAAIQAAIDVAALNQVAGKPLILRPSDIVLGTHEIQPNGKFRFTEGANPITSVRVFGNRDDASPSGAVPLFFGPLLGRTTFEPKQISTASRLDRDIALVLDVSGSMNNFGRFRALRNALTVFLDELASLPQEEVVSLSVYSDFARRVQPMTRDMGLIQAAFDKERPSGRTGIGRALRAGIASIIEDGESRRFAFRELIVMTDGNHNEGINPRNVIDEAIASNIKVHTITFGRRANQALMKEIAESGGGSHLHANTNEELVDVFREIALQVPVVLID